MSMSKESSKLQTIESGRLKSHLGMTLYFSVHAFLPNVCLMNIFRDFHFLPPMLWTEGRNKVEWLILRHEHIVRLFRSYPNRQIPSVAVFLCICTRTSASYQKSERNVEVIKHERKDKKIIYENLSVPLAIIKVIFFPVECNQWRTRKVEREKKRRREGKFQKIEINYRLLLRQNRWKDCNEEGWRQTSCIRKSCNDGTLSSRKRLSLHSKFLANVLILIAKILVLSTFNSFYLYNTASLHCY